MLALYVVLALVALALLVTLVVVAARRRRAPAPAQRVEAPPTRPPETAPEAVAAPEAPAAEVSVAPSFRDRLGKARGVFSGVLTSVRGRGAVEGATWDELEEALLRADVGVATTDALLGDLRRRVAAKEVEGGDQLIDALRDDLVDLLEIGG